MENLKLHTCCFFGHRKIDKTPELIERLTKEIEVLIWLPNDPIAPG